jgi:hypothetical protein
MTSRRGYTSASSIIDALQGFRAENVFNPWRDSDPMDVGSGAAERCSRLERHFDCQPEFLLLGEAAGYQGCHFSGVPFTNESLLLQGRIPRIQLSGRISRRLRPWCEPSATIVWGKLHDLGIAQRTVLWNTFAWHPHRPGVPLSNRAPTREEIILGMPLLRTILLRFGTARIVTVGRTAQFAASKAGIEAFGSVRHPAMGGATRFREELAALVRRARRIRRDRVRKNIN